MSTDDDPWSTVCCYSAYDLHHSSYPTFIIFAGQIRWIYILQLGSNNVVFKECNHFSQSPPFFYGGGRGGVTFIAGTPKIVLKKARTFLNMIFVLCSLILQLM
jgi:hypothetical protein